MPGVGSIHDVLLRLVRICRGVPAVAVLLCVAAAIVVPTAWADSNLLANGTFDSSVDGWFTQNATLSLTPDGLDGTSAALVTRSGSSRRFSISAPSVATTIGGAVYTASASVRSTQPDRKLCLTVGEWSSAKRIDSVETCLAATGDWQQFPLLTYTAVRSGDVLAVTIDERRSKRRDSFVADDVILTSVSFVAPAMVSPPSIAGVAEDGQTLQADPGTWTGTLPIGFAYQWQSSTDGTTWTDVASGGTGQTYTVVPADVGSFLRVVVTASNLAGSATAESAPTEVVVPAPPAPLTPPTISGSEIVGATLTASTGTWSGTPPLQFDFQWQSSSDGGTTWTDVGTDADTYVLTEADVGNILRVVVTATNGTGTASATSAPTQPVATEPLSPTNVQLPSVGGLAVDTATLTAVPGVWTGSSPLSFAYQWLRCGADGTGCTPIDGATSQQFQLQPSDEGTTLAVTVTATNAAGSAPATSPASAVVAPICGGASSQTPPTTYSHVIWIWMENRSYGTIIGPPGSTAASRSPFVNGTLAHDCGLATNYHNVAHPSLPNYIAATSGSTQGLQHNGLHHFDVTSLFDQVQQAGLEWRSYQESMPVNCDPVEEGLYPVDHNPALDYTGLAATCPLWDIPLGDTTSGPFAQALTNDTLPAFSFVVPNSCNSTESCPVETGDAWLAMWLPLIVASPAFQSGTTAVFVTWDEGQNGSAGEDCLANLDDQSCHVPLLVLSPTTPAGTLSSTLFTHYSLLETTEQLLGLPLLGAAADPATASLRPDFHL